MVSVPPITIGEFIKKSKGVKVLKKWLLLIAGIALTSCASYSPARVVLMQNAETKQTAECKVDPWGHINRKIQIDSCVDAYKQAGYVKLSDSHPAK